MIKPDKSHFIIVAKTLLIQGLLFCFLFFMLWGSQKIYAFIDPVVFPQAYPAPQANLNESQKGVYLLDALSNRMRYEINSTFGWSANDIVFNKWVLDNRAYRQFGTYKATKELLDHYSIVVAKLGNNDREDENLYSARFNSFSMNPERWGMLFLPSAEDSYDKGLKQIDVYKKNLLNGKAVFNCRADDVYSAFELILSEKLMGHALGLLQNSQDLPFYTLDNRIYEVQGMALVIRDYVKTLYDLYPEMAGGKNNEENMKVSLDFLDRIATYNPLYITSSFNSGELIISYLLFARNRLEDVKDSIRI